MLAPLTASSCWPFMLNTLTPADLAYRDGVPYSALYDDIYHPAEGGIGQAEQVFLHGCGLPARWAGRETFVILETGFGTGLNFLVTWAAWRNDPARCGRLHFLSAEKHPFSAADLAHLHGRWPEFADLSAELLASWPTMTPGFHRIALDGGRVQLTLMLGDAFDCVSRAHARVDAIYLDGFDPAHNADMWQPGLLAALARRAQPGALAASYSVAAPIRHGLTEAGFVCEKRAGYGHKRHSLVASWPLHPAELPPPRVHHVAVIGAGVAGAAIAHALAARSVAVTVIEREQQPAQGASGNPAAVFRPVISRDDNAGTRLTRAAFLHDLRAWRALGESVRWSSCGVLHLACSDRLIARQRESLHFAMPPASYARWVERDEARALANWPVEFPAVLYPQAGWIDPVSLCRAWLGHPGITLLAGHEVERVQCAAAGWQVQDAAGKVLVEADCVVLASALDVARLVPDADWPIEPVRGQINLLPPHCLPEIRCVIAGEGNLIPGEQPVIGATYDHDDFSLSLSAASDQANRDKLEILLPGVGERIGTHPLAGRAALRATLHDRLPLVGEVAGQAGLYVASCYASRGVAWAGLLGEALADRITGQPSPLESDLLEAIAPDRFRRRKLRIEPTRSRRNPACEYSLPDQ